MGFAWKHFYCSVVRFNLIWYLMKLLPVTPKQMNNKEATYLSTFSNPEDSKT